MKGLQIFKAALNTTWPEPGETFIIGIYGESSVFFVLTAISRARKIGNSVVFVKKIANHTQIEDCNIVFVSLDKKDELESIKKLSLTREILVITEEGTDEKNCDINLVSENEIVAYEINKTGINKKLTLSEKFLADAKKTY